MRLIGMEHVDQTNWPPRLLGPLQILQSLFAVHRYLEYNHSRYLYSKWGEKCQSLTQVSIIGGTSALSLRSAAKIRKPILRVLSTFTTIPLLVHASAETHF